MTQPNSRFLQLLVRSISPGEFQTAVPYGSGHINDTYCATFVAAGEPTRYILQRINQTVFGNPAALMQNIERVTSHLCRQTGRGS